MLYFICAIILSAFIYCNEAAVATVQVTIGEPYNMDFGEGMIVIRRRTKAHKDPQYIFASSTQDGSWTTNGVSCNFSFVDVF